MNKLNLLILLCFLSLNSFCQNESTKIPFVAYWSVGDSYDFRVTKIKQTWVNDKLTKNDSSRYVANFLVLDSTETSYKIQWSYKNTLFNSFQERLNELYDDKVTTNNIFEKYDITRIIYKTNELGEFIEIENWQEIGNLMKKLLTELEKGIGNKKPEKIKEIKNAMAPMLEIYSSKEGVEQLIMQELQYFHFPFGVEYDIMDTIKYEQEFPNMIEGDPIKGEASLTFEEVDFENDYCVLKEEVIINPEDTKRLTLQLLRKMGIDKNLIDEVFKTAVFDISDLNYYQYYYYPGVPHALYGSRNIIVEVSDTKNEKLDETLIELIYDE